MYISRSRGNSDHGSKQQKCSAVTRNVCTVKVVLLLTRSSVVKIVVTFLSFCDNLAVNWRIFIVLDPFSLVIFFGEKKFCCTQSAKENGLMDG